MSAANPVPASSRFAQSNDNQFKLQDRDQTTRVVLNLERTGPIIQGQNVEGPKLEYEGTEGTFSFSGQEVVTETTAIGKIYTVTLHAVPDLATLSFTLLLPEVVHDGDTAAQAFNTIAIKSERRTSIGGTSEIPGANPKYTVMKMHGTAQKVFTPL